MEFTLHFIALFLHTTYLGLPLLLGFVLAIGLLGQIVGRIEGWSRFDAFYWSFITALTVGYGDLRPTTRLTRALSIVMALLGLMFTGLLVAITVATATEAFNTYVDIDVTKAGYRSGSD